MNVKTEHPAAPRRVIAVEDAPFWQALDDGEFKLARCPCGAWYARTQACLRCGNRASALQWLPASGRGAIKTFVIFDKPYHPWFATRLPYVVAVVALEEGPELLTNVIEVPVDAVAIGMKVQIVIVERDGQSIHQARAVAGIGQ